MANPAPVIISDEFPGSTDDVIDRLRERGSDPLIIRPSALGDEGDLTFHVEGQLITVHRATSGQSWQIGSGSRVWLRRPKMPVALAEPDEAVRHYRLGQMRAFLRVLYSIPAQWMNDYFNAARLEGNKPLQSAFARQVGLQTIPTVCTSDPSRLSDFIESVDGSIALKSLAPWSSTLDGGSISVGTYTNRLTKLQALDAATKLYGVPLIAQPYIEKAYELRVNVVGGRVIACRIDSQRSPLAAVDWRRYDLSNTPHTEVALPASICDALLRFTGLAGITFGAVDMIVNAEGDHIFVEVNPSGQFGWVDALAGTDTVGAICDWLLGAAPTPTPVNY